jgi:hypothetical protein
MIVYLVIEANEIGTVNELPVAVEFYFGAESFIGLAPDIYPGYFAYRAFFDP